MPHILFVSALPKEADVVKQEIKKLSLKNIKISFFCSGVGNYKTILSLQKYILQQEKIDFIVNIGVCGHTLGDDVIIPKESVVGDEYFRPDNPVGDDNIVPGNPLPKIIQIARIYNLANKKETIPPVVFEFAALASIACSETPVFDEKILEWEKYVDMESYGFELVCDVMKVPRILLKTPVDRIWDETKNFDFKKALRFLAENINYEKLISDIGKYLGKRKKEVNFEKYFSNYEMSFSHKEIFKKFYYRFQALSGEDFEKYFQQNKTENIKVFLQTLELFLENKRVK